MIWLVLFLQVQVAEPQPLEVAPEKPMGATNAREVIGPPRGSGLTGEALERETNRVSALLRCPVCQGLSVADSPSAMATNMKRQVRELLSWGYTEDQVLSYFETSYGEFVRLRPPARGINWLVWIGPLVALILGASVIAYMIRRAPAETTTIEPADPELDPYVTRARELTSTDAGAGN